jgi:hypothetical protein
MVETPRLQAKRSSAKSTWVDEPWFLRAKIIAMIFWVSVGFEPTNYERLAL